MPSYLSVSVRFLDPLFHGKGDGGKPEWPPSPLRLFQAIVAASATRWREPAFAEKARTALQWLETGDPVLITPNVEVEHTPYRLYVPNNVSDIVASAWARGSSDASIAEHRVEKDVRPTRLIDSNTLHYLFPLPDNKCPHLEILTAAARSITHLGWGIDMVAANASVITEADVAQLKGERWRPAQMGGTPLRVSIPGTLDALMKKHEAFLNRLGTDGFHPVPPLSAFRVVNYRRDTDPVPRPWVAFHMLDPESGKRRSYPATDPVKVAGMIRCAAGKVALDSGRPQDWVNKFVYGHHDGPDSFPRFSYLPLPSIQTVIGVGRISRVLIAEPIGSEGKEVAWIKRLLAGHLTKNEQGRHALLVPLPREDHVLNQYVKTAQTWTTVTPVALPGSDDGMASKTNKLFTKMLHHAGYSPDSIEELEFHRVPFWRGAEDAKRYRPRSQGMGRGDDAGAICAEDAKRYRPRSPHHLANCTMYHMRIRWKYPMPGPIALGAGRHCGLGVFAITNE